MPRKPKVDFKLDESKIEVIHPTPPTEPPTESVAEQPVEVAAEVAPEKPLAPPRREKVAIVGFTPSRDQAPYRNLDYDIWCLNDLFTSIPRFDRVYQIHSRQSIDTHTTRGEKETYIKLLRELNVPVYMVEAYPDIPNSVAFPLEEIKAHFGYSYFTNSVAYMIAHAIYEGYKEIHIYGVDMAVQGEYFHQRPSCEFWLGIAVGRGIKLYLPNESDLLKTRFLYGFQEDEEAAFNRKCVASVKMMNERLSQARSVERNIEDAVCKYEGGIEVVGKILEKCKDEATLASLNNTITQMDASRKQRLEQARSTRDVVCKYEGAIQAIGEIQQTWATCLDNPDPIDVGPAGLGVGEKG